ncbi:MAG: hypothetical protein KDD46_03905, partial [Bdellovibrionales bacterium]|nr:hypothetical protein [Bdellovibrionales bacterium]
ALSLDATVFKEKPAFEKPKEKVNVTAPSSSPMQTTEALMALVLYAQNTEIQGQMNKEQFLGFIQDQELFRLASESLGQEISPKDPIKWIDHWDDPAYKALLAKVLVSLDTLVENQAWEKVWTDCFSKLKKQYVRMLAQKIQIAESTGQLQEVELLSKQMMETKKFEPVVTK